MTYDYLNEPEEIIEDDPLGNSDDLRDMKIDNKNIPDWKPERIDPKKEQKIFDRWFGIGKKEGGK